MSANPTAKIERLLGRIHNELLCMQGISRALVQQGVNANAIPNKDVLIAFACLGDHDRTPVEYELQAHWEDLIDRGLVHGETSHYSTPCLRLLFAVAPATSGLTSLRSRLQSEPGLPAPADMFRCPTQKHELMWGEAVRVSYETEGVDFLLITPGAIFNRQALMLDIHGEIVHGCIELPGDDGEVIFTMLGSDGKIYRHSTEFKLRDDGWLTRSVA